MKEIAGVLDECRPTRPVPHRGSLALRPGERLYVRGWLAHRDPHRSVHAVFVSLGGERRPVAYGFPRPDVAATGSSIKCGFEGWVDVPCEMERRVELRVTAELDTGDTATLDDTGTWLEPIRTPVPAIPEIGSPSARSRFRVLGDTLPEDPKHGRSRRSVRPEALLEAQGWALTPHGDPGEAAALLITSDVIRRLYATERIFDGEATLGTGNHFDAGFRSLIDLGDLKPGLYTMTPLVQQRDGTWASGTATFFECSVPYEPAPKFVSPFRQPVVGGVEQMGPIRVRRGEPIVVRGWAVDPAAGSAGRGVYARLDDHHFLPLPSQLPRPDVALNERLACEEVGFAGIVDTTILLTGEHTLDVALYGASGNGWYPLASRTIEVRS